MFNMYVDERVISATRSRVRRHASRYLAKESSIMFVHEAMANALATSGVDTMFGLIGDANLFLTNAFVEAEGGRYVSAVHESSAVMMAQGYASRSGRVGVATVTQGPGLTNSATALIDTVRNNTAVVLITGDTAPTNTHNQQTLDQAPFVEATGAGYLHVSRPGDAALAVRTAIAQATAHRRPVVVNCPTEFQWEIVSADDRVPDPSPPIPKPSDELLDEAVGRIASARRPLVVAGRGATEPTQREAVLDFAQRIGAPIATTLRARNLYSAADGGIGVCGTLATDAGVPAITDSDCVIIFGSSLNTWTTAHRTLFDGKSVIYVDADTARVELPNAHVDVAIRGDAAATARTFIKWLDAAEVEPSGFRQRVCPGIRDSDLRFEADLGETLTLAGVLSELNRAVTPQRTVVWDGGRFLGQALKFICGPDYRSEVLSTAFGAVGMGMGAAIGAACAAGDEPTIFITGDGGFMMNGLAELHSAVRASLPLIVVICNDGSYGAEYDQYVHKSVSPALSLFSWPSFAKVAHAMDADGVTVASVADVPAAVAAAKTPVRPLVIDVQIDPAKVPEVAH
jgi:thiamine pyrophosphate-dependent acetolactate synthase large subunit-like protein